MGIDIRFSQKLFSLRERERERERFVSYSPREMLCPQNFFTILLQQILNDKSLLAVSGRQKSNFNSIFKLESIIIYYLGFFVKILWM